MGAQLKQMMIFLANNRPRDEMWYIQQLLPAIKVTMAELEGANITFHYVTADKLNETYLIGFAAGVGVRLEDCIVVPFNDADGGQGRVLKVLA